MKSHIKIAIAIISMFLPLSFALAHENNQQPPPPRSGVVLHRESEFNFKLGGQQGEDINENDATSTDKDAEDATSTAWMHGEKDGHGKHFSTTTPPGIVNHHGKDNNEHATTTKDKDNNNENNDNHNGNRGIGEHRGLPSFLRWLFGLPATTTIGQIRADIQASTTATSSSPSEGLGFWAHVLGFFHFGKDK